MLLWNMLALEVVLGASYKGDLRASPPRELTISEKIVGERKQSPQNSQTAHPRGWAELFYGNVKVPLLHRFTSERLHGKLVLGTSMPPSSGLSVMIAMENGYGALSNSRM